MARTYTQAQVNAALNYLLTGGPNGGPLTKDQYAHETRDGYTWNDSDGNLLGASDHPYSVPNAFQNWPKISQSALDFCSCLWLIVQQGVLRTGVLRRIFLLLRLSTKDAERSRYSIAARNYMHEDTARMAQALTISPTLHTRIVP